MSLIKFFFFIKKKSPICQELHILFFVSSAELCCIEMQDFTNNLYLSVHFPVTTRAIAFNTYRAGGSWKASRKGLEWSKKCECTIQNMMIKNVQREKETITWTRWLEEKETTRKFWALLTCTFYIRNTDFCSSFHYKELSSWSRTKPQTSPSIRLQCCGSLHPGIYRASDVPLCFCFNHYWQEENMLCMHFYWDL